MQTIATLQNKIYINFLIPSENGAKNMKAFIKLYYIEEKNNNKIGNIFKNENT